MSDFLLSLAAQIPIVVVFVWFVLERDKRDTESRARRDTEWRQAIADMQVMVSSTVERQFVMSQRGTDEMVKLIRLAAEERKAFVAALSGLADTLRDMQYTANLQHDMLNAKFDKVCQTLGIHISPQSQ